MRIKDAIAELKKMEKEFGGDQYILSFNVCPNFVIDLSSGYHRAISPKIAGKMLKEVSEQEENEGHMWRVFLEMLEGVVERWEHDPLYDLVDAAKSKKKGNK